MYMYVYGNCVIITSGMISSGIARQGNLRYNEEQLRAREDPLNIYKDRFYERKNAERAMHIRNACVIL